MAHVSEVHQNYQNFPSQWGVIILLILCTSSSPSFYNSWFLTKHLIMAWKTLDPMENTPPLERACIWKCRCYLHLFPEIFHVRHTVDGQDPATQKRKHFEILYFVGYRKYINWLEELSVWIFLLSDSFWKCLSGSKASQMFLTNTTSFRFCPFIALGQCQLHFLIHPTVSALSHVHFTVSTCPKA